jgi:hypothetical protein
MVFIGNSKLAEEFFSSSALSNSRFSLYTIEPVNALQNRIYLEQKQMYPDLVVVRGLLVVPLHT